MAPEDCYTYCNCSLPFFAFSSPWEKNLNAKLRSPWCSFVCKPHTNWDETCLVISPTPRFVSEVLQLLTCTDVSIGQNMQTDSQMIKRQIQKQIVVPHLFALLQTQDYWSSVTGWCIHDERILFAKIILHPVIYKSAIEYSLYCECCRNYLFCSVFFKWKMHQNFGICQEAL